MKPRDQPPLVDSCGGGEQVRSVGAGLDGGGGFALQAA